MKILMLLALSGSPTCETIVNGITEAKEDVVVFRETTEALTYAQCLKQAKKVAEKFKKCDSDFQGFIDIMDVNFKYNDVSEYTNILILKQCPKKA